MTKVNKNTKQKDKKKFNPSAAASSDSGIFGLPFTLAEAKLVLLPVPWEVTTSYGVGASLGPQIIFDASSQVDLYDIDTGNNWNQGYHMLPVSNKLLAENKKMKALVKKINNSKNPEKLTKEISSVNKSCNQMVNWVYSESKKVLDSKKTMGLIGGDHSTPLGFIKALGEKYNADFAVLHFDAHADLRNAYQGFEHSHASIMYNVMKNLPEQTRPKKLVQVGIRDFCEEELEVINTSNGKIKTFFDAHLKEKLAEGIFWAKITEEILNELPKNVYISFDIDGLDPALCPNTGTPVLGGLSTDQAFFIFKQLVKSGRKIIGFDLNEVSPGAKITSDWDGNVGARVLYKLCNWTMESLKT